MTVVNRILLIRSLISSIYLCNVWVDQIGLKIDRQMENDEVLEAILIGFREIRGISTLACSLFENLKRVFYSIV